LIVIIETDDRNRVYCGKVCNSKIRIMVSISVEQFITSLVQKKCL